MLIAQAVTQAEYEQALTEIRRLVALEPDRDSPTGNRLEAMFALAETFDAECLAPDLADIDAR
jgi:hypothetical protein